MTLEVTWKVQSRETRPVALGRDAEQQSSVWDGAAWRARVYCAGQHLASPRWLAAENTLALLVSGRFAFGSFWNQYGHR